ncbi:unnamed protein product, partial [marine sediment metagenome]
PGGEDSGVQGGGTPLNPKVYTDKKRNIIREGGRSAPPMIGDPDLNTPAEKESSSDSANSLQKKARELFASFRAACQKFHPEGGIGPVWGGKVAGQMKTLVRSFDDDDTELFKFVEYCVEHWEKLRKKYELSTHVPSVGVIVGFRESFWTEYKGKGSAKWDSATRGTWDKEYGPPAGLKKKEWEV